MRRKTLSVKIGKVLIGSDHSIKTQSMTTASTMDTNRSVDEAIRIIKAGGKLVRFTAPNINEAKNLLNIKNALLEKGNDDHLVDNIHFKTINLPAKQRYKNLCSKFGLKKIKSSGKKNFQLININ